MAWHSNCIKFRCCSICFNGSSKSLVFLSNLVFCCTCCFGCTGISIARSKYKTDEKTRTITSLGSEKNNLKIMQRSFSHIDMFLQTFFMSSSFTLLLYSLIFFFFVLYVLIESRKQKSLLTNAYQSGIGLKSVLAYILYRCACVCKK